MMSGERMTQPFSDLADVGVVFEGVGGGGGSERVNTAEARHVDACSAGVQLHDVASNGFGISTGCVTSVADTPRHSNVISLAGNTWAVHGWDWRGFGSSTGDYDLAGKIAFSAWVKSSADGEFIVNVQTNAGLRGLWYYSNGTHGTTPYWVSGSGANERACFPSNIGRDGVWRRIERNLQQDITAAWPGEALVEVRGLTLAAYTSSPLLVDDLRFSNAMTTEHVVIAPGSVGHIARQRATNPGTYAHTDRYFHYDQVGSVLCETDSAGALAQTHHQDAFGNTLASWSTGYLGGDTGGFHHNTKEYDVNVEMLYMYQRWYSAELGVFASRAPMPRNVEHPYSAFLQSPLMFVDPLGLCVGGIGIALGNVGRAIGRGAAAGARGVGAAGKAIAETAPAVVEGAADAGAFILGNAWTLPNTAVGAAHGVAGVAVAPLTVPFGGELSYLWIGGYGVQFINNPLMASDTAICTGGAVSSYAPGVDPEAYLPSPYTDVWYILEDHEGGHQVQGIILGPLFLVIYPFKSKKMEESADHFAVTGELKWTLY